MSHARGNWIFDGRDVIALDDAGWSPVVCSLIEARFADQPSVALDRDTIRANGNLIAAAPYLLETCRAMLATNEAPCSDPGCAICAAMALIAKAVAKAEGGIP